MTKQVDVNALVGAPHWMPDRGLESILAAMLRRRATAPPEGAMDRAALWPPSSFGLDRTTLFRSANEERREAIVTTCAAGRLEEAYAIEKLGLAFCAKMTLLATTTEERMLYLMIGSDEATHLHWLEPYARPVGSAEPPSSAFITLLESFVENGSQAALTLLVQIVLEGWGVQHYRLLARDCSDERLRTLLGQIVIDEARHHGSGERLMRQRTVDDGARRELLDSLAKLLALVACGPQGVVAALAPTTDDEAVTAFAELDAEGESRCRLELLRGLIEEAEIDGLVDELVQRQAFVPLDARACAAVYRG